MSSNKHPRRNCFHRVARAWLAVLLALAAQQGWPHRTAYFDVDGNGGVTIPEWDRDLPRWMSYLPNNVPLAWLSLPGTHDTMAFNTGWGDSVTTQSMSLDMQLRRGVRALDIRCRCINNRFAIHHADFFLNVMFGDVLNTVQRFLRDNPSETVFMRVKEEHTRDNCTQDFVGVFLAYANERPGLFSNVGSTAWPTTNTASPPTLGQVRGRIVLLRSFAGLQLGYDWPGGGAPYSWTNDMEIQDDYWVNTIWADKWGRVIRYLGYAENRDGLYNNSIPYSMKIYVNALNANGGAFPYAIASGHSAPFTGAIHHIGVEGVNVLLGEDLGRRLAADSVTYTGIVPMDFPGVGLIQNIISVNFEIDWELGVNGATTRRIPGNLLTTAVLPTQAGEPAAELATGTHVGREAAELDTDSRAID